MAIKVIITGATGMVGEGVLLECLAHPEVEEVLLVGRKAYGRYASEAEGIAGRGFYGAGWREGSAQWDMMAAFIVRALARWERRSLSTRALHMT